MTYKVKDKYFKMAKDEGYAARSVYKLQEIDQKFKVIKSGQAILDLGSSPGSWSQYCSQKIGHSGRILGIDLTEMQITLPNATWVQADLRDLDLDTTLREKGFVHPFDIVMSDMAPNTTGIKSVDQARSMALCELALEISTRWLKPKGTFICKFFQSGDFGQLRAEIKKNYERVEALKPDSTRSISKEIFLVGLNKKS